MAKLVKLDRAYWPDGGYGHWCPGCNSGHEINVDRPNVSGAKWTFDGNMECPTFTPSINMRWGKFVDPKFECGGVCHYFIRNGKIEFCSDSTHTLAGTTVELPDIPSGKYVTSRAV